MAGRQSKSRIGMRKRAVWCIAAALTATTAMICVSIIFLYLKNEAGKAGAVHFSSSGQAVAGMDMATHGEIDFLADVISHPEDSHDEGVVMGVVGKLKGKVVDVVVGRGVAELRGNFKGLVSDDARRRKVEEILSDIENYDIDDAAGSVFTENFICEGMRAYTAATTPEERALFDPIVRTFVRKLNMRKKK